MAPHLVLQQNTYHVRHFGEEKIKLQEIIFSLIDQLLTSIIPGDVNGVASARKNSMSSHYELILYVSSHLKRTSVTLDQKYETHFGMEGVASCIENLKTNEYTRC